ncbi:hypothetical protein VNN41_11375 (plasmid) [Lactococcus garvieae]|uniref:hypothetical protein n=1 Tax=Lactococcus garvieae TaxID=1363 RepID=UPI0032446228
MKQWFKRSKNSTQNYLENVEHLLVENRTLSNQVNFLKKKIDVLSEINEFKYYNKHILQYVEIHGKTFVVSVEEKLDRDGKVINFEFMLHDMDDFRSPARWHTHIDCDIFRNQDYGFIDRLYIQEFKTRHVNQGYGTFLMNILLDYVSHHLKVNEVIIIGWLSPEDEKDKENHLRRDHFYQKFGFEIKGDHIYKKLACNKARVFSNFKDPEK